MLRRISPLSTVALVCCLGCSGGSTTTNYQKAEEAPAAAPIALGGPQRVTGVAPPPSGGFPAIVILEPTMPGEPLAQVWVPYMDQVQQTFIPPLLLVRTGQPVEFRNSDVVLHNVRVREDATRSPAFNVAIPTDGKYQFTFARDGFYDVGCDIHPGMASQIVASTSPYIATGDAQGQFAIDNVPPGAYHAVMYAGTQKIERVITVAAGAPPLDLTHP